ncbi:hypothetical protein GCM10025862_22230 [Arsenicicoccus piscis]|uniref:tRNA-dihydrouridine synthase n=2 Tax=Arsenicicoccus piscis TaxID=673954 RepID=A0ABQ6HPC7_9MICO|nr:hypothetical protein GCM10025862_22230 [Arsenicicoccus piscis]
MDMTNELSRRPDRPRPGGRRSATVVLGVTALVAGLLTGCGAAEPDYAGVCLDPQTGKRVADQQCDDGTQTQTHRTGVGGMWYFLPFGRIAPAIGQRATGGSFSTPPDGHSYVKGGVPSTGGTVSAASVKGGTKVSRGGFGGSGGKAGS